MDPVPPRLRPDQQEPVAGGPRPGAEQPLRPHQANAHRVDEWVARVALVEVHLAADRRDPHAVPVAAHAGDHALEVVTALGRRAEAERVEQGDGPRSHGDHVAKDAAHPGRGALVGLDEAWVVVAFHLEHGSEPVADIHNASVLSGTVNHPGRFRR